MIIEAKNLLSTSYFIDSTIGDPYIVHNQSVTSPPTIKALFIRDKEANNVFNSWTLNLKTKNLPVCPIIGRPINAQRQIQFFVNTTANTRPQTTYIWFYYKFLNTVSPTWIRPFLVFGPNASSVADSFYISLYHNSTWYDGTYFTNANANMAEAIVNGWHTLTLGCYYTKTTDENKFLIHPYICVDDCARAIFNLPPMSIEFTVATPTVQFIIASNTDNDQTDPLNRHVNFWLSGVD